MRILRLPQVIEMTGRCRSSIFQEVRDGTFPAPIRLSRSPRGAVGWLDKEIFVWIEQRVQATRGGQN